MFLQVCGEAAWHKPAKRSRIKDATAWVTLWNLCSCWADLIVGEDVCFTPLLWHHLQPLTHSPELDAAQQRAVNKRVQSDPELQGSADCGGQASCSQWAWCHPNDISFFFLFLLWKQKNPPDLYPNIKLAQSKHEIRVSRKWRQKAWQRLNIRREIWGWKQMQE